MLEGRIEYHPLYGKRLVIIDLDTKERVEYTICHGSADQIDCINRNVIGTIFTEEDIQIKGLF
jgi:hypothetical protein